MIENHFIIDRSIGDPDSAFSMWQDEFAVMVERIRCVEKALRNVVDPTKNPEDGRKFARSLYVAKDMKRGDRITEENVRSVRPGYGLPPRYLPELLGKCVNRDLKVGKTATIGICGLDKDSFDMIEKKENIILFTQDFAPRKSQLMSVLCGCTGFALAVAQLAEIIHRYTPYNVYVVCSAFKNEKIEIPESYTLLARNFRLCLKHLRFKDFLAAVSYLFSLRDPIVQQRFRLFKERLYAGLYVHYIREYNPKVSFIHSLLPATIPFVSVSLHTDTPMILVCHGDYATEKDTRTFLLGLAKLMAPPLLESGSLLSCVSSGVLKYFSNLPNVFCVPNPVPPVEESVEAAICCPDFFNIAVCGSVCERKNQIQIVRALRLLTEEERSRIKVHFVGMDRTQGKVHREAHLLGVEACCVFYGMLSRSRTLAVISGAQITMTTTLSEAFGLPILEGYTFGVPAVFFSDIAPVKELGDPQCALLMPDKNDETVAEAIREAMKREWNHAYIKDFSKRFSEKDIARMYAELFEKVRPNAYSEKAWEKLVRVYLWNRKQMYYSHTPIKQHLIYYMGKFGNKFSQFKKTIYRKKE